MKWTTGAEDVGEGDVRATAPRGQGDAGEFLGFEAGGDCSLAEQGRGDAEACRGLADALAEQFATDCEDGQASDEERQNARTRRGRLGGEQRPARAGEPS